MSGRYRWWLSLASTAILLAASGAGAQEKGKPAPEGASALEIGARAPEFTLKDQDGKDRSLGEFLGKGKVALVFYRSADW